MTNLIRYFYKPPKSRLIALRFLTLVLMGVLDHLADCSPRPCSCEFGAIRSQGGRKPEQKKIVQHFMGVLVFNTHAHTLPWMCTELQS